MNNRTSIITALSLAAAWLVAVNAHAQAQAPSGGGNDSNTGKQIATAGAPNGVAPCASCHGAQGEGNPASNFPRIGGQPTAYLARQLTSYANGSRANPIMEPIAKALTSQQIEAVSSYYAALAAPSSKPASPAATTGDKRGQVLANVGDDRIGVQGCANCHGPGGIGEPPNYPYLASQHTGYLTVTLGEWKKGTRKTDPSQQMNMIARRLSEADIASVAAYYSAQPVPPPAAQRVNIPTGSAARPATLPQVQQGSVPTQGIGTEQGAPTTGGGQGPGGGGGASGSGPSGSPTGVAK
jgi:cytochrome c553